MNLQPATAPTDTRIVIPGTYDITQPPRSTPWGGLQESETLMWGTAPCGNITPVLWQVHTAGHGGTRVHPQLAAAYFKRLPRDCQSCGGSRLWFEEDCESSVPLFIFYNGLSPDCWLVRPDIAFPRDKLLESVVRWMPSTVDPVRAIAAKFDSALTRQSIALRAPLPA